MGAAGREGECRRDRGESVRSTSGTERKGKDLAEVIEATPEELRTASQGCTQELAVRRPPIAQKSDPRGLDQFVGGQRADQSCVRFCFVQWQCQLRGCFEREHPVACSGTEH